MARYPGRSQFTQMAGARIGGGAAVYADLMRAREAQGQSARMPLERLAPDHAAAVVTGFLRDRVRFVGQLRNELKLKHGHAPARRGAGLGGLSGLGATPHELWTQCMATLGLPQFCGSEPAPDGPSAAESSGSGSFIDDINTAVQQQAATNQQTSTTDVNTQRALTIVCGGTLPQFGGKSWGQESFDSGKPPTFCQIVAWGSSAPQGLRFTTAELRAVLHNSHNKAGWAAMSDGGIINLLDPRYAKGTDGRWGNRNHPEVPSAQVVGDADEPPHTVVAKAASSVGDALDAIGNFIGNAAVELWHILETLGDYAAAFIELLGWLLGLVPEVVNPGNLFRDLNPLAPGSKAYDLVNNPAHTRMVNLLTIVLFGPLALGMAIFAPQAAMQAFVEGPGGANGMTKFLRDLISALNASSAADKTKKSVQAFEDLLVFLTGGIEISIPGLLQIGLLLLTNIPLPPVGSILMVIAADPVAQDSLKQKGLPAGLFTDVIPITEACFRANSAEQYLTCAQKAIEEFFPGFIQTMQQKFFVSLSDLRVVVAALWASNGDMARMLDTSKFPGVHDALVGIGVVALVEVAKNLQTPADNFITGLKGVLPDDLLSVLVTGEQFLFHVTNAADATVRKQTGLHGLAGLNALTDSTSLPNLSRRALYQLQRARWDVKRAVLAMRLDEYTNDAWPVNEGGDGITKISDVALFRRLRVDINDPSKGLMPEGQSLLDFLIKTFGDPIAHLFADVLGGPAAVPAAVTAAKSSAVATPAQLVRQTPRVTKQGLEALGKKGKEGSPGLAPPSAASQIKTSKTPAVVASAIAAGGAGFLIGGPPGAVVGLLLGGAIGSRAK
jgi:hypothetical protein